MGLTNDIPGAIQLLTDLGVIWVIAAGALGFVAARLVKRFRS